ncbi:hypothetical protein MGU_01811 [Metarhizium guizhouense ARSEF 977]|uniref:Uncharacterized protein n=1 Tax=Metarhizium guizhouense (strain ARSEF 977) TaxID=1276136 RepID=A0A0B4HP52_METGA|nr:hypothetical protein MGU_01811 [Metarhizium guizhouense ARSEF 977]
MSEDDRRRIRKYWEEGKLSSDDMTLASVSGSDNRDRVQETEPKGGSGVQHSTGMARKTITVTTSIEQVITPNTRVAEKSKLQTEITAIPPSNTGNINAVSCLTPMSTTADDNRATPTPSKTQVGVAQLRPPPVNADDLLKMELHKPYALFGTDREDLSSNNATSTVRGSVHQAIPGSCKIGQLSVYELGTSSCDLFDQTKDYGGTDANNYLPPITEFVSYNNTKETAAINKSQSDTGDSSPTTGIVSGFSTPPLSAVGTPVPKICTPSSAKTDVQVELAVEAEKPRGDSEAEDVIDICGIDVDFDLNCGARRITEEDFVRLGLHNLSWAKLSDTTTGPLSISTEDLRGLKNTSKDRPFLVGGANARDGSEENVTANKTGIDIGANSLRSMEFVPPIDISGSQDSPGDALPGSSPKWQLPKADDEPQTIDSAKTLNVINADRAKESG